MTTDKPHTIDEYIACFPQSVQEKLQQIRQTIKETAPDAAETIKYAMPTFTLYANLVHFAAFKNHIGFYPAPTGNKVFEDELAPYKQGKGSVQFPIDKQMPLALITKIVQYQIQELAKKGNCKEVGEMNTNLVATGLKLNIGNCLKNEYYTKTWKILLKK